VRSTHSISMIRFTSQTHPELLSYNRPPSHLSPQHETEIGTPWPCGRDPLRSLPRIPSSHKATNPSTTPTQNPPGAKNRRPALNKRPKRTGTCVFSVCACAPLTHDFAPASLPPCLPACLSVCRRETRRRPMEAPSLLPLATRSTTPSASAHR
jgi:hypothetical protein